MPHIKEMIMACSVVELGHLLFLYGIQCEQNQAKKLNEKSRQHFKKCLLIRHV